MKLFLNKLYSYVKLRFFIDEVICIYYKLPANNQDFDKIDIRYSTETNLTDILNFQHPGYVEEFRHFLELGDRGYFAYIDNKCVHRSWVKSNEQVIHPHWAYPMRLKPNQHFIHYCETAPQARGMGIYPAVLSRIASDFKDKGEILISIDAKNTASIRGVQKTGFIERERIKVLMILGMKFITKQS